MSKSLVKSNALSLDSPHFLYTAEGLFVEGSPTFEQCETELSKLKHINKALQFFIGDLLNYMEGQFGESYSQALDAFDYSIGSFANMKSVAKEFPADRRRESIPYTYYAAIQSLDAEIQEDLLDKVETGEIATLSHLRNRAKIIRKHSGASKAECEHENMLICKKCGFVSFE